MNRNNGCVLLVLGLLLSCPALLFGQSYGNEWINYDQQYLRIKVAANGIYKVSYQEMEKAGFPVSQINPRNLQLFHRGQEQAIHIEGEADEVLDAADYMLFYGRRNDGTLDKELYLRPELQPHNYYNLYSDSTSFYLTYQSGSVGKRMPLFNQENSGGLSAEPFYIDERLSLLAENFSPGMVYGIPGGNLDTHLSYGDEGEGFFSNVIAGTSVRDFTFTGLTDAYTEGPLPQLKVQLVGRNSLERNTPVRAGPTTSSLGLVSTASFSSYKTFTVEENLPWTAVDNNQTIVRISATGTERVSVAYIRFRFPRRWNMGAVAERTFRLVANSTARYIEVESVPENTNLYDVSDPNNIKRIAYQREGTKIKAMLPPSGIAEQVLFFSGSERVTTISKPINFRQIPKSGRDYIIISHQRLMKPAGGYDNPVRAYAAYRASTEGGGHDTLVVEMQELYDQFSFGEYSPVAIRRFVKYVSQVQFPQHLFLMGKSLEVNHWYYRKDQKSWTNINRDLVPTFGFPGADIPFVAQLQGSGYAPAFPVGRFSARTPDDVASYLKKVIEDETITPKSLWLKRLIHLGGGNSAAQARQLKSYLKGFENIAVGPYLGAKVTTLSKNEDVVVQQVDISKDVNQGVRLITFFGHSGVLMTDVEIGFVSDPKAGYNNKGYYPRFLINGCYAGNVFAPRTTFSEEWLYTANKGSLNFIGHSSNGYTTLLNHYSTNFYRVAITDEAFLGASIGKIQQETIRRYLGSGTPSPLQITQAQQMVLQGDPALVLFEIVKSDFETNDDHVSMRATNNQPLNLSADSLEISVVMRNFGKALDDSLQVQVDYWVSDNSPKTIEFIKVRPVYHQDTAVIRIGTNQLDEAGLSNFRITLNPGMEIPEYDYNNNTATLQILIPNGGTINLLPYNYAVIKKEQAKVLAQGTDLLSPARDFSFKLDTAYAFNSASLQEKIVRAGGLASWLVSLPEATASSADTIVYYWGSQLTSPSPTEDPSLSRSSFTYIKEAPKGWAQAHEGQFTENSLSSLKVEKDRIWEFIPQERLIQVTTFGSRAPGVSAANVELIIDGVQYILNQQFKNCATNSINAIQFDKNTLGMPFAKIGGAARPESCGRLPQVINNFRGWDVIYGDNDGYNLQRYLTEIPESNWVLLVSIGDNSYTQWPASVKQQVQTLGIEASVLNQLTNGEPMVILGRKGGAPGSAIVALADKSAGSPPANEQTVNLESKVTGIPGTGIVESRLIGPAVSWQDVAIQVKEDATDEWALSVLGVDAQGNETPVLALAENNTLPLTIDAATYPYVRLRLAVKDTDKLTPPQLKFWRVGYEALPEGVLLAGDTLKYQYAVNEGQLVQPGFKFVNISEQPYTADSLEVTSNLLNVNRSTAQNKQFKIKAPAPGDTVRFGIPLTTNSYTGKNDLLVKVNPYPGTEVSLQNNIFDVKEFLMVRGDSLHPFIDVAFDGSYITNGEIVSPNPLISVLMRDENKFRLKQDTTGIHLYLKRQCEGCAFERVSLNNPSVHFYPASKQEDCKIEFVPGPLEDGLYTLQVQAEDASGNKAGTRPYAISFEVISESSLTHFYPYPNPFSTSTRFVFTLTGNEVPEDLKIQIMTVSGKVIREIMKEELGPLRIGNNITQYAWDGTDDFGDSLANGVYLYRVVLGGSNASQWKHRATKGDQAFKQSFGKLYILR